MSLFLSRTLLCGIRCCRSTSINFGNYLETASPLSSYFHKKNSVFSNVSSYSLRDYTTDSIQPTVPPDSANTLLKKKIVHKKNVQEDLSKKEGHYLTLAYATAHSYDLKSLKEALVQQKLYEPGILNSNEVGDMVVANAVYSVGDEPREIIFFKEGAVVFWNCSELEASNVLDFVRKYEIEGYPREVVEKEKEIMTYVYNQNAKKCQLHGSSFVLVNDRDNSLERYTFSHAMAQSARLGAWEARLETLAAAVRAQTRRMETTGDTTLQQKEVVRKLGELFSLRHRLNVESDLLDTPDLYWEDARLERLYSATVHYFAVSRRTEVLNERLAHCVELLELASTRAADRHHIRLEWMIIALILIEVCFELLHAFERYAPSKEQRRYERRSGGGGGRVFSDEVEESMFAELTVLDT